MGVVELRGANCGANYTYGANLNRHLRGPRRATGIRDGLRRAGAGIEGDNICFGANSKRSRGKRLRWMEEGRASGMRCSARYKYHSVSLSDAQGQNLVFTFLARRNRGSLRVKPLRWRRRAASHWRQTPAESSSARHSTLLCDDQSAASLVKRGAFAVATQQPRIAAGCESLASHRVLHTKAQLPAHHLPANQ